MVGWLVVFNVPSTARSFRDSTPIYCPLRRTRHIYIYVCICIYRVGMA